MNEKKQAINQKWKQVSQDSILDFQNILNILNRYYSQFESSNPKTESSLFREEVGKAREEDLEIYLKKFGRYEYLIFAIIHTENGKKSDSWIHIDGVSEERDGFKKKNLLNHPVFEIICMQDIFEKSIELEDISPDQEYPESANNPRVKKKAE